MLLSRSDLVTPIGPFWSNFLLLKTEIADLREKEEELEELTKESGFRNAAHGGGYFVDFEQVKEDLREDIANTKKDIQKFEIELKQHREKRERLEQQSANFSESEKADIADVTMAIVAKKENLRNAQNRLADLQAEFNSTDFFGRISNHLSEGPDDYLFDEDGEVGLPQTFTREFYFNGLFDSLGRKLAEVGIFPENEQEYSLALYACIVKNMDPDNLIVNGQKNFQNYADDFKKWKLKNLGSTLQSPAARAERKFNEDLERVSENAKLNLVRARFLADYFSDNPDRPPHPDDWWTPDGDVKLTEDQIEKIFFDSTEWKDKKKDADDLAKAIDLEIGKGYVDYFDQELGQIDFPALSGLTVAAD